MSIIAICGAQGSGKSTVSDFIQKNYGYKHVAFADILKEIVIYAFDIKSSIVYGNTIQDRYHSDLRFSNEAWFLLKNFKNVNFVQIYRQGVNQSHISDQLDILHMTDYGTKIFDGAKSYSCIYNNGTLDDLYDNINEIMR
jgi:cytidylate kinase